MPPMNTIHIKINLFPTEILPNRNPLKMIRGHDDDLSVNIFVRSHKDDVQDHMHTLFIFHVHGLDCSWRSLMQTHAFVRNSLET